jgi:hypothetical protein
MSDLDASAPASGPAETHQPRTVHISRYPQRLRCARSPETLGALMDCASLTRVAEIQNIRWGVHMAGFFWNRRASVRIRVLLIPTSTFYMCNYGCDLHKLAKVLNGAQGSYEFVVPLPKPNKKIARTPRLGINLTKRRPLSNHTIREAASKTLTERRISVSTYITVFDAAEQCLNYAEHVVGQGTAKPLSDEDIIVVIGGEVVVPDVGDNEFEGDAEFDAYSCISVTKYDLDGTITKTSEGIDILDFNEALTPGQSVAHVSLRRLPKIFPEINFTDLPNERGAFLLVTSFPILLDLSAIEPSASPLRMMTCLDASTRVIGWVVNEQATTLMITARDVLMATCITMFWTSTTLARPVNCSGRCLRYAASPRLSTEL